MEGHSYLRTHDLQAEHMLLNLEEIVTEMHGKRVEGQTRSGVTLVKQGGMSVVLTHLQAGGTMEEHAAPGAATVQVLDGRIRVRIGNETLDVSRGRLLAFDSGLRHSVEALQDATLLLTLTSPA